MSDTDPFQTFRARETNRAVQTLETIGKLAARARQENGGADSEIVQAEFDALQIALDDARQGIVKDTLSRTHSA